MKKRILAMLLSALLVMNISACVYAPENEIDETIEGTTFPESPAEESKITTESANDLATYMRFTLNDDGKSYSVCPTGLPEVIKELVIPGKYKGSPVTKVYGEMGERSIETIVISEGIEEIHLGFYYCCDIKNIYIPASVNYIAKCTFNCYATMGGHGHTKSNVIEKIVVAEGNPHYYVDGNCLIDRRSQKIILGCNSSVIPNDGSVISIGEAAFANCHTMESVVIPKSITEIEYASFDNCDNLKQMHLLASTSTDNIIVNFNEEFIVSYKSEFILCVPDIESLETYKKHFGSHINIELGTP